MSLLYVLVIRLDIRVADLLCIIDRVQFFCYSHQGRLKAVNASLLFLQFYFLLAGQYFKVVLRRLIGFSQTVLFIDVAALSCAVLVDVWWAMVAAWASLSDSFSR